MFVPLSPICAKRFIYIKHLYYQTEGVIIEGGIGNIQEQEKSNMALFKSVRHPVDSDGSLLPHVFGKPESLTAKQTQVDVTGDTL